MTTTSVSAFARVSRGVVVPLRATPDPAVRLLCTPFAGGTATAFRAWPEMMPAEAACYALQLPGRGERLREQPFDRLAPIVEAVARELPPLIDRPLVIFGHSMGAIIGFELARYLHQAFGMLPVHLFVSGRPAPQAATRLPVFYDLPDAELIERVARMGGLLAEVRENDELMQLLLPVLRADFAVTQTYAFAGGPPLDCPITALGGARDEIPLADIEAWREQTTRTFAMHVFDGDHFFIRAFQAQIGQIVSRTLSNAIHSTV